MLPPVERTLMLIISRLYNDIEELSHTIETLRSENEALKATQRAANDKSRKDVEWQKAVANAWIEEGKKKYGIILEHEARIHTLKKRIAQMESSMNIQREILALKAERADVEKKLEELSTLNTRLLDAITGCKDKLLALATKGVDAEWKTEDESLALKAKREQLDKEIGEREDEIKLIEENNEDVQ